MTLDTAPDLEAQARAVHQARTHYAALKAQADALLAAWKEEHAELLDQVKQAEAAMHQAEEDARQVVLIYYEAFPVGKKSLPFGFGVRNRTTLEYDFDLAANWARANAPALLVLDKARFEKAITGKVIETPPFVEVIETTTATIPIDLAKHLTVTE